MAVALGDVNFSDLREFGLGKTSESQTVSNTHPEMADYPTNEPALNNKIIIDADTTSNTPTLNSNSAMSLSHILQPHADQTLSTHNQLQNHPNPAHNSPNYNEMAADPYMMGDADPMILDADDNVTSMNETSTGEDHTAEVESMPIDKLEEESGKLGLPEKKKGGLMGWLNIAASKKRTQKDAEISSLKSIDSDAASQTKKKSAKKLKFTTAIGGPGQSRSATAARDLRQKVQSGEFKPDPGKLERWITRLQNLDPHVQVNNETAKHARHSRCGKWYTVKEPYDTTHFKKHVNDDCQKLKPTAAAEMPEVGKWKEYFDIDVKNGTRPGNIQPIPCPGLTDRDDTRISQYLGRSGAPGGGARSITDIAKQLYGTIFRRLTRQKKKEVLDTQIHEQKWWNDHQNDRVFAQNCQKTVTRTNGERDKPCTNCAYLLHDNRFKDALRKIGRAHV